MEFKKSNNDLVRVNWPEGSKERALVRDFPGCKTVAEALKKAITQKQNVIPEESSEIKPELADTSLIMKEAVLDIEKALNGRDIEKGCPVVRARMSAMPLNTKEDILKWRDAWLKVIKPSS